MNLQSKMLYSVVLTRTSDYRKDKDSNYHKDKSYYFSIISVLFGIAFTTCTNGVLH